MGPPPISPQKIADAPYGTTNDAHGRCGCASAHRSEANGHAHQAAAFTLYPAPIQILRGAPNSTHFAQIFLTRGIVSGRFPSRCRSLEFAGRSAGRCRSGPRTIATRACSHKRSATEILCRPVCGMSRRCPWIARTAVGVAWGSQAACSSLTFQRLSAQCPRPCCCHSYHGACRHQEWCCFLSHSPTCACFIPMCLTRATTAPCLLALRERCDHPPPVFLPPS